MKRNNPAEVYKTLPKFDRSVSLLCWAYNEEETIREFLQRAFCLLDSAVEEYEIVLIDDGSTDRTYDIAREFQKKNPRLRIFRNESNLNVGMSSRRAIEKASKEFLFWQTVDWCYDISNLRVFLEYLKDRDIVQGVRRAPVQVKMRFFKPFAGLLKLFGLKHLTRRSDTIPKAVISVINYMLIRILFRVPLSDFQNVSFYRTEWIQSLKYEAKSSFANPEALIKSHWKGISIIEVPINFLPREKGGAKGTRARAILDSVQDIFSLWFKWVVLRRRGEVNKGKIQRVNQFESQASSINLDITTARW
jgi:glycosyltransferase involved in cell wall biosynthesis